VTAADEYSKTDMKVTLNITLKYKHGCSSSLSFIALADQMYFNNRLSRHKYTLVRCYGFIPKNEDIKVEKHVDTFQREFACD